MAEATVESILYSFRKLPKEEKLSLVRLLEKDTFEARLRKLLRDFKKAASERPISFEEITQEVEDVRKRRYESRY